jgi:hypothetical protein
MSQACLPFAEVGTEYDRNFIKSNPISARCVGKCKRRFEGKDGIHAPTLDNCACFYCGGKMKPIDAKAYAQRLAGLPKHIVWQGII